MTTTQTIRETPPRPLPYAARLILTFLERLAGGTLVVDGPDGFSKRYGDDAGPVVRIVIRDWQVLQRCMKSGDIGFAECYMEGLWHSDDPAALVELFCRNRDAMDRAIFGTGIGRLAYRLKHLFNRNTRSRARKNIEAHYDLGNAFYTLWLDSSMTYSSALFEGDRNRSLRDAQDAKYRRILERLAPAPGARILEIGCGWGGFAEMAARDFGVHVTGLTLSSEQLAYARERLAAAGLSGNTDLQLRDYRAMDGRFDAVVSIEMFEAVGEEYWDSYFDCVRRNLKPGGRALIQSITIDEALFERYRKSTDFIQQYIFPGGMLPSPEVFRARAAAAGLATTDEMRFGRDYAETLKRWRASFMAVLPEVRTTGFDERFTRLWEFYLAYCEGAFNAGSTDVIQFELTRGAG
jgi:cyclopropane-fatty-acyl-phospholipid synthase